MTKIIIKSTLLILVVLNPATSAGAQPVQDPTTTQSQKPLQVAEKNDYTTLLERVKKSDTTVDFTELRMSFYHSRQYNPDRPMMTYRPLWGAVAQMNYTEAIKIAESVLEGNFVEVNAHMVAQIAYQETGNAERAQFHKYMTEGLLNSIKSKGDGKSIETAFHVISINEEYALLRSIGLRPFQQSLQEVKGGHFDTLKVVDPLTNQQSVVYFNVDLPFNFRSNK
ncbi:MAG: DUF4919 domain-containing protein [Acidobacteria bacterium]|nr:DUF4919 domain-containing protein [Acidobacteriota bacterium]